MIKKTMLYLLLLLSVLLLAACQKQPQPEIKLPEPQALTSIYASVFIASVQHTTNTAMELPEIRQMQNSAGLKSKKLF